MSKFLSLEIFTGYTQKLHHYPRCTLLLFGRLDRRTSGVGEKKGIYTHPFYQESNEGSKRPIYVCEHFHFTILLVSCIWVGTYTSLSSQRGQPGPLPLWLDIRESHPKPTDCCWSNCHRRSAHAELKVWTTSPCDSSQATFRKIGPPMFGRPSFLNQRVPRKSPLEQFFASF